MVVVVRQHKSMMQTGGPPTGIFAPLSSPEDCLKFHLFGSCLSSFSFQLRQEEDFAGEKHGCDRFLFLSLQNPIMLFCLWHSHLPKRIISSLEQLK
jgi:hypothetical protein